MNIHSCHCEMLVHQRFHLSFLIDAYGLHHSSNTDIPKQWVGLIWSYDGMKVTHPGAHIFGQISFDENVVGNSFRGLHNQWQVEVSNNLASGTIGPKEILGPYLEGGSGDLIL